METKFIGMLFGARLLIETSSEGVARDCQKWLQTLDLRYREAGEEKLRTDMAELLTQCDYGGTRCDESPELRKTFV